MPTPLPILQMRRTGLAVVASAEAVERARAEYASCCYVRLPRLLEPELWPFLQRELANAQFEEQVYEHVGAELSMVSGSVEFVLNLMSNDRDLLEQIRRITGCDGIRGFIGRVYRFIPGSGHEAGWHNDLGGPRLAAMSINLSSDVYSGGVLEIRRVGTGTQLQEIPNTVFGDAIVFQIASDLQHRVTAVSGAIPKTAFAGWFVSEPASHRLGAAAERP